MEDECPFGVSRPIFRGELLVSGSIRECSCSIGSKLNSYCWMNFGTFQKNTGPNIPMHNWWFQMYVLHFTVLIIFFLVHVGKYTSHGWYGYCQFLFCGVQSFWSIAIVAIYHNICFTAHPEMQNNNLAPKRDWKHQLQGGPLPLISRVIAPGWNKPSKTHLF